MRLSVLWLLLWQADAFSPLQRFVKMASKLDVASVLTTRPEDSVILAPPRTTGVTPKVEPLTAPPRASSRIHHRNFFDRDAWIRGWSTVREESAYELEGDFPIDLSGTFFQNGPSKFEIGKERIMHPFDADGMIRAVTFDNGKAWFRNRFVRTPGFEEELEANRICYRGVFGTAKRNGNRLANLLDLRTKNVANTHVLMHANKLYALWEAAAPIEMDPATLETKGLTNHYGDRYAAHYKVDRSKSTICNFCIRFAWPDPSAAHKLTIFEHDLDTGKLLYERSHFLPGLAIGHDMAITDRYMCFFRGPSKFDPLPFVLGKKGPAQCFLWDDTAKSGHLHLAERGPKGKVISIDIPPCFCFHIANGYDDPLTGEVVLDVVMAESMFMADTVSDDYPSLPIWEAMNLETDMPKFELVRYRVDPSTGKLVSTNVLSRGCGTLDFPVVHPDYLGKQYKFAYVGTSATADRVGTVQGLAKINVRSGRLEEKWLPEPHQFLSEVSIAPKASGNGELDAYLLAYLMDGRTKRSSLVIFDAADISAGPVCQSKLRQLLPHSLHGCFVDGYVPEFNQRVRRSFTSR